MEGIVNEILILVKKKMREQGAWDKDAYRNFIEETINYFQEKGKISEDDNLEFLEDRLIDLWSQTKNNLEE